MLKSLSRLVAGNTNTPYGEVAQRLWGRLSVDMQRADHRAFARRCEGAGRGSGGGTEVVLAVLETLAAG